MDRSRSSTLGEIRASLCLGFRHSQMVPGGAGDPPKGSLSSHCSVTPDTFVSSVFSGSRAG